MPSCYLAFVISDNSGKITSNLANSYSGTFDWTQGELRISSAQLKSIRDSGGKAVFQIFLGMSGEFWVDDLVFQYTPLTRSGITTTKYDFENQTTALPSGFQALLGWLTLTTSANETWSQFALDHTIYYSGNTSLKLSGANTTNRWYELSKQILTNYSGIYVSFAVKGNNIHQQGNQIPNSCYIGIGITNAGGNMTIITPIELYNGTFDWVQGELRLSAAELKTIRDNGSKVNFIIFLGMSGDLWIDNLTFEYTPLTT